jgi:RNA recognition motif-containing protein
MKLFVARLPQSATSESLKNLFESFGNVTEAKVIMDRETGMSKGYGFVQMATKDAAENAISHLNGFELDGKDILVKPSDPSPNQSNERRSHPKPSGDHWGNGGHEDRNKFAKRYSERDHSENLWDEKKNLRPRRKRT